MLFSNYTQIIINRYKISIEVIVAIIVFSTKIFKQIYKMKILYIFWLKFNYVCNGEHWRTSHPQPFIGWLKYDNFLSLMNGIYEIIEYSVVISFDIMFVMQRFACWRPPLKLCKPKQRSAQVVRSTLQTVQGQAHLPYLCFCLYLLRLVVLLHAHGRNNNKCAS